MTGPQVRRGVPAQVVFDHAAALAGADRILVTAHPAEPLASVALRAGEAALDIYLGGVRHGVLPDGDGHAVVADDPLRRLLARHLCERLPDDDAGELHAAVVAAAVVAALDVAVAHWRADGARADGAAACRERFRAVAALLPPDP